MVCLALNADLEAVRIFFKSYDFVLIALKSNLIYLGNKTKRLHEYYTKYLYVTRILLCDMLRLFHFKYSSSVDSPLRLTSLRLNTYKIHACVLYTCIFVTKFSSITMALPLRRKVSSMSHNYQPIVLVLVLPLFIHHICMKVLIYKSGLPLEAKNLISVVSIF